MAEVPVISDSTPSAAPPQGPSLSPAMRQYRQFKQQYPDYVLFFRMGDFYEMFWEDARLAHRVLGVALTSRNKGAPDEIPMAGVPFHSVEGYLRRMIAAGYRVALCEQMEDPSTARGLIRREVTRLITPGTLTDEPLLEGRSENYLAAVAPGVSRTQGYQMGLCWVDLSTGSCAACSGSEGQVLDQIARLHPAEVLVPELPSGQPHPIGELIRRAGVRSVTTRAGWQFTAHHAREQLRRQWQLAAPQGIGFEEDDPALSACAAVLSYLQETQKSALPHLRMPRRHVHSDFLAIDPATYRSLEIDRTVRSGSVEGSLLAAIDRTRTSMGARLLRQWVRFPLCDLEHIAARQEAIAALLQEPAILRRIVDQLADVCDIERIVARITVNRASPRDLAALGRCLAAIPQLIDTLARLRNPILANELATSSDFCRQQAEFLQKAISPEPPAHLREGGVIAPGFDAELDRLRDIGQNSAVWLVRYQERLAGETGIPSLKVSYNRVFGYYIEVTDAHRQKVPPGWTRKQTVKNAERYITEELKAFENEALGARDRAIVLEQQLFEKVRQTILPHVTELQEIAASLARLDVLAGLALLALDRQYCRPTLTEDRTLRILDGRHPVLEQQLGSEFVANDLLFDDGDCLHLITGPNMAGKSTFIRQVALIVILAQIGSYVPAREATIGMADQLFARIGASDELHAGQSTFMVEMIETANILNNATPKSLVILDEIGRGTSTLDGLSLAWAIAEHIASDVRCRTLFATHYHELTDLAERFTGVKNLNVAVREWEDQVIFLHRIVEGGTDRSYGIHVARLAGVPQPVLQRARELLGELTVQHVSRPRISRSRKGDKPSDTSQLPLFSDPARELLQTLSQLKLDELSPVAAFDLLRQWKQRWGQSR
ncbi:MAG: DNA mismatch repair protein MutS [Phycisphaerae bacterium]|nr:DNA mismatch repair protein MutS [Phycisphaerae bacterium]MDW8261988.1 DNA mismatch repair protein MutS [Phycisphaerales bacterium]